MFTASGTCYSYRNRSSSPVTRAASSAKAVSCPVCPLVVATIVASPTTRGQQALRSLGQRCIGRVGHGSRQGFSAPTLLDPGYEIERLPRLCDARYERAPQPRRRAVDVDSHPVVNATCRRSAAPNGD